MVEELTLAEAVALTAGRDYWHTRAVPRLGIEPIHLCDGPHGLRKQRRDSGFDATSVPATCFPTASALAASWDVDLLAEIGAALGAEARAGGVSVLLGPGANIKRSALCGRNFEYFSEDPYLSSRLAAAWIDGVQSTGVGASLKHYAANNQEHYRYTVDARVDERTLREIYLASFEYAVIRARPATVMAAYNRLNGHHCTSHAELLTRVLREEWGFDGAVISDWGATDDRSTAIAAGLDLDMPGLGHGDEDVLERVHSGELPEAAVRRAAGNVIRLVERTAEARKPGYTYDREVHHRLARRAAAAGTVLLRNDGTLPLRHDAKVAVIGAFARTPRYQGAGSSGVTPHRVENLWDELVARIGPERLAYADGTQAVVEIANHSDVAVVVVGLLEAYEVEGIDRDHLDLPAEHNALVDAVAAVNPRTVVVVVGGAPALMPWADRVATIVQAYLGGQAAGGALAEVLLGLAEPGGRLAETFPRALADNPVHTAANGPTTVEYREGMFVGYRHYDRAGLDVAFPFGHGLSYTTFAWTSPEVSETSVRLTVTNTGPRAGKDVVQVYVRDVESTVERPEQELKGFAPVWLEPGAAATVEIALDRRCYAVWDPSTHRWVVEAGTFEVLIGTSSRDIRFRVALDVPGEVLRPQPPATQSADAGPVSYTMDTPLGDIRHPVVRGFLATLVRAARIRLRSTPGNPMAAVVGRMLAQTPPRMLPMVTEGRIGPRFARGLVAIANNLTIRRGRGSGRQ